MFATFGTHLLAAKALNVAISAATVVLTYVLGARAFGVRAGMLAALLLALAPGHAYFSTLVMTEVLFAFGFLAVVALLIWWTIDAERAIVGTTAGAGCRDGLPGARARRGGVPAGRVRAAVEGGAAGLAAGAALQRHLRDAASCWR